MRKSEGWRVLLAPGLSRMRFSPVEASTRITATPVLWLGMVRMEEVSIEEDLRAEIRGGPKASVPTEPIILTVVGEVDGDGEGEWGLGRERRAQATASGRGVSD